MKKIAGKIKNRWQRLGRWVRITVLTLVVLAVAIRLALPSIVLHYVNRQLDALPDYHASVADIDMQLIRGAYKIKGLKMEKETGGVPVPFLEIPVMDLSVQWGELFHGSVVGEIVLLRPRMNFVKGPTEEQTQTGVDEGWKKTLESLFPFSINKFEVRQGDVRFKDFHREPKVDIYITNLFATATNLTNSRDVKEKLPAGLVARGKTIGEGNLEITLHMNPMADMPTFELTTAVSNMNLVALNNFMRAYGKFDVASGEFQMYTEIAAADGEFEGSVKPFFKNLEIFDWDQERKKNILEKFWEAIVAGVAKVFQNQPKEQLATTIPLHGDFDSPDVDIWATIGGILKNAFVKALVPKIDRDVSVEEVQARSDGPGDKSEKADQLEPTGREEKSDKAENAEESEQSEKEEKRREPLQSPRGSTP